MCTIAYEINRKNNGESFCLQIDRTQSIPRETFKIQGFYFL